MTVLQPRPAPGRAGVSAGLAGGGGGIQDLIAGLRQRVSPTSPGAPQVTTLPAPAGPVAGGPGYTAMPMPTVMPFKPPPAQNLMDVGGEGPPGGFPEAGPVNTQIAGGRQAGGLARVGRANAGASVAPRPARIGGTDEDFATLPDVGGPGPPGGGGGSALQEAGFKNRRHAAAAARRQGHEGSVKSFIKGGGKPGGSPPVATKPVIPGSREGLRGGGARGRAVEEAAGRRGGGAVPYASNMMGGGEDIPPDILAAMEAAGPARGVISEGEAGGGAQTSSGASMGGSGVPGRPAPALTPPNRPSPGGLTMRPAPPPRGGMQTLPAEVGGTPGALGPAEQWAQENMPAWARERGADSGAILNFIRKNPGSPLAQKFSASGLMA